MIPRRLTRLGLFACDAAVVAGILLIPLFAWKAIRVVEVGMIPLLALPWTWRSVRLRQRDWLLLLLFGQYCLLVAANNLLYPALAGAEAHRMDDVTLYLGTALLLLLMLLRLRHSAALARIWRVLAPLLLIGSVLLLFWQHATTPPPQNCRVDFLAKHLLIPPLWLAVLTVAAYSVWEELTTAERWLRHGTVLAVIVALAAFMGARAGLISLLAVLPALALILGRGAGLRERMRVMAEIGLVCLLGLAAGIALDLRAECGFTQRLAAPVTTLLNLGRAERTTETVLAERLGPGVSPAGAPASTEPGAASPASGRSAPPPNRATAPATVGGAPERGAASPPESGVSGGAQARKSAAARAEDRLIAGVYIRPLLWEAGLEKVREAPVLGWGAANEKALVPGDFPHFHNQYLSWTIWGGLVMLASGVVMLMAPLLTFGVRKGTEASVLALAMIGPTALYLFSETWLLHTTTVLSYPMVLALFYAMSQPNRPTGDAIRGDDARNC